MLDFIFLPFIFLQYTMLEVTTTPTTQFDQVTNTSYLGKSDSGSYVFSGVASSVSVIFGFKSGSMIS